MEGRGREEPETGMAPLLIFDESKGIIRRTLSFEAGVRIIVRLRLGFADFQLRFLQQVSDEKRFTSGDEC